MENVKEKRKLRLWQRLLIILLAVVVTLTAALAITAGCVWGNEISTAASFKQLCPRRRRSSGRLRLSYGRKRRFLLRQIS